MKIGSTSYIYPDEILPNVRRLAGRVDDVELVLFEVDDRLNNLPDADVISELDSIARAHGMTYTVHLPTDLRLAAEDGSWSVQKALRVIKATRGLAPHGFVVHLEGGPVDNPIRWRDNSVRSLEILAEAAGGAEMLCVENLESHSEEMIDGILANSPVSCCVDVGHLWKRGEDPAPLLDRWLPRARVIHLHGFGERDHQGLSRMNESDLDQVTRVLLRHEFAGPITMEVFNENDFLDCLESFQSSLRRVNGNAVAAS